MKSITNTFVLVAPDSKTATARIPVAADDAPTVAAVQYALLNARPYALTLEDLIFETHVRRSGLTPAEVAKRAAAVRVELFAKPHPCMRASPLTKTHGWGVHHDAAGRMALFAVESAEYRRFAAGPDGIDVVVAMRTKRA